jgi:hypothetical protein
MVVRPIEPASRSIPCVRMSVLGSGMSDQSPSLFSDLFQPPPSSFV